MKTPVQPDATPPTEAEKEQENKFEIESANPDKLSPFHLNIYARTFLGGLLFFAMILFYVTHITHISEHLDLENHGQSQSPAIDTQPTDQKRGQIP